MTCSWFNLALQTFAKGAVFTPGAYADAAVAFRRFAVSGQRVCSLAAGRRRASLAPRMFTGIVEETGQVLAFAPKQDAWALSVRAKAALEDMSLGDSIAVNGCCLTATRFDAATLHFDVLEESRRLTNFQALAPGALVNLERSLRFGGKVGGHFVTGHIDALGTIEAFEKRGKDFYVRVRVPAESTRYIVHKGSIAMDGISLTIAEVTDSSFAVWLIPHTIAVTNMREKKPGDLVNLEFDLLGKHVEKLLLTRTA